MPSAAAVAAAGGWVVGLVVGRLQAGRQGRQGAVRVVQVAAVRAAVRVAGQAPAAVLALAHYGPCGERIAAAPPAAARPATGGGC